MYQWSYCAVGACRKRFRARASDNLLGCLGDPPELSFVDATNKTSFACWAEHGCVSS